MNRINHFGKRLKEIREKAGLPQRVVAGFLQIDSPMLSKIERGERKAKKSQLALLSVVLNADIDQLKTCWLADQLLELVDGEEMALKALQVAEDEVEYGLRNRIGS